LETTKGALKMLQANDFHGDGCSTKRLNHARAVQLDKGFPKSLNRCSYLHLNVRPSFFPAQSFDHRILKYVSGRAYDGGK